MLTNLLAGVTALATCLTFTSANTAAEKTEKKNALVKHIYKL
jgi:hypothetical protein